MKRFLQTIAKAWSIVLYPLFIPTYGMTLFCMVYSSHWMQLTAKWWAVLIGSTFVMTCVIPMSAIGILMRQRIVKNWYIEAAQERTTPYIYTLLSFGFWCVMLLRLHVPAYLSISAIGATVALLGVTLINLRWKISAHLCALGGLTGGMFGMCLGLEMMPSLWVVGAFLVAALLLMYARLYLNAHTDWQVIAGYGLGLICTFLPVWIKYGWLK